MLSEYEINFKHKIIVKTNSDIQMNFNFNKFVNYFIKNVMKIICNNFCVLRITLNVYSYEIAFIVLRPEITACGFVRKFANEPL